MEEATTSPKRNRRTPEERAAYHQAKANRARSEAAKRARALDTRLKILIGSAFMARADRNEFKVGERNGRAALADFIRIRLSEADRAVVDAWAAQEPPERK